MQGESRVALVKVALVNTGSTTYSGINTKNILITDEAKQTLLTGLSAKAELNQAADRLTADYEAG
ncbi:hypothetical protein, partial [Oligella sp. HMSC09E12]